MLTLKSAPDIQSDTIDESSEFYHLEKVGNIELQVFPNPTSGKIRIRVINDHEIQNGTMILYSIDGRIINQVHIINSQIEIDLSGYADGIYFLTLQINKSESNWKIVKKQ